MIIPIIKINKDSIKLDVYCARLDSPTRDQLRYILDTTEVYVEDLPCGNVRLLKEKEVKQFGEDSRRCLVLEAWDWPTEGE